MVPADAAWAELAATLGVEPPDPEARSASRGAARVTERVGAPVGVPVGAAAGVPLGGVPARGGAQPAGAGATPTVPARDTAGLLAGSVAGPGGGDR